MRKALLLTGSAIFVSANMYPIFPASADQFSYYYPRVAEEEIERGRDPAATKAQGPKKFVLVPLKSTNIPTLGIGFNLLTGMPVNAYCISGFTSSDRDINDISQSLSQSIDSESTYYKINQTVSAKGSYGAFGGSGSYSSINETRTTYNGTTIVVSAKIERDVESLTPSMSGGGEPRVIDLEEAFSDILLNGDKWRFRSTCGDGFVRAIVNGTEMYAVANLEQTSFEQKSSVEKAVAASYGGDLFNAEASSILQQEIKKTRERLGIQSWTRGSSQEKLATTIEELKEIYKELPSSDKDASRPLYALVEIYSELPSVEQLPQELKPQYPYVFFEGLTQTSIRLNFLRSTVQAAIEENGSPEPSKNFVFLPGRTSEENAQSLADIANELDDRISSVMTRLRDCYGSASSCNYDIADRLEDLRFEYRTRARMPISSSGIRASTIALIKRQMSEGDALQRKYAVSSFASYSFLDNILRPSSLRCEQRVECAPPRMLGEAAAVICKEAGGSQGWEGEVPPPYIACKYGDEDGASKSTSALSREGPEIAGRKISIPVPRGVIPSISVRAHSGIEQRTRIQYFDGENEIHTEYFRIGANNFGTHGPRYFQRALGEANRLEIVTWGVGYYGSIADLRPTGPEPEAARARVRRSKSWEREFVYAFESDDHWNNNTWNDTRIGYDQNLALSDAEASMWRSLGILDDDNVGPAGNDADVQVFFERIDDDGESSFTTKAVFDVATSQCVNRVTGSFDYTAVYEDGNGRTSEKVWSGSFDFRPPSDKATDSQGIGAGERLVAVHREAVTESRCED